MANRPIIPQLLAFDTTIGGATTTVLSGQTLTRAKLTNSVTTGSAKAELVYAINPGDPRKWPWDHLAMDPINVQAWASSRPNDTTRTPIWTGFLDAVTVTEDPAGGMVANITASTVYKAMEVATETPGQYDVRVNWQGLPVSDIIAVAAGSAGVPVDFGKGPDPTTDVYSVANLDPQGTTINPQYQDWASIAASASTLVGQEFFANEAGRLQFRQSQYNQPPVGAIPTERLIAVSMSLDTDAGIVNQVLVRWGSQENVAQQASAGPPAGYDVNHYLPRILIIATPWINDAATGSSQAQWYADWALSWAFHNSRTAVVSVAFWPQVRIGQTYTLDWPSGTRNVFYVASAVHDITVGGAPVTTLGLTYGRPLDVTWSQQPAPVGFGKDAITAPYPVGASTGTSPNALPTGAGWTVTYYTPADPGQAPLNSYTDATGVYLNTRYGAKLYAAGWTPPQTAGLLTYGKLRPCAFDPSYEVPELNCTLSPGDVVRLADGTLAQCWDIGGAVVGRHLDIFHWLPTDPGLPPTSPQTVVYLNVANLNLQSLPSQLPFGPQPGSTNVPQPTAADGTMRGRILQLAQAQIGKAYVWGAYDPAVGFDCSGLVYWIYVLMLKLSLPRVAQDQYNATQRIAASSLLAGDLVFFSGTDPNDPATVTHVGIYAGSGTMIAADNPSVGVEQTSLSDPYWQAHLYGYGRVAGVS